MVHVLFTGVVVGLVTGFSHLQVTKDPEPLQFRWVKPLQQCNPLATVPPSPIHGLDFGVGSFSEQFEASQAKFEAL